MNIFTEQEFKARAADAMQRAREFDDVQIQCDDGTRLSLHVDRVSTVRDRSTLDVQAVTNGSMTADEIVELVREGREREPEWLRAMMDRPPT
ncbi:MAG TPA: hypothetical protein VGB55_10165 [Tepidisphaeraceae bacterium]|jgi:hypothetical protein